VGNVYDHLNGLESTQRVQKKRQDRWAHEDELKMVCDSRRGGGGGRRMMMRKRPPLLSGGTDLSTLMIMPIHGMVIGEMMASPILLGLYLTPFFFPTTTTTSLPFQRRQGILVVTSSTFCGL